MNISEKIEDIRRQPEHIRLRYVWACVAISMLIIIVVWIFSIASMFAEEKNSAQTTSIVPDLKQQLQVLQEQSASLKNNGTRTVPADNAADTGNFQYPAPQSETYSDLPNAGQ